MSKFSQLCSKYQTLITWVLRIFIGSTFLFSGIAKSIDIWGFTYKIEQYLNVWNWEFTRPIVVISAMALSAIEFIIGLAIISGSYKRISIWIALTIMSIMLPLSAYLIHLDPIDHCGCFGDVLVISNNATFIKNIFISIGLVYLFFYNKKISGIFHPQLQWIVASLSYIYILLIGFIGYNIQPLFDFRQFKTGEHILSESTIYNEKFNFIYEKDGIHQSFSIDNLPDSSWTFIDREPLNNPSDEISQNITIYNLDDEDVTSDVISSLGEQILLLIPEIKYADLSYSYLINEMYNYISNNNGNMIGIFASNDKKRISRWCDISLAKWPKYIAEDTLIKELARGKISVVYLKDGVIQWKRALSSIPTDIFSTTDKNNIMHKLYLNGDRQFLYLTVIFIGCLALIFIFSWRIDIVKRLFLSQKQKKECNFAK